VGIGGPVGSGMTALMEALCKAFHDRYDACAIGLAELAGAGVAADGPEQGYINWDPRQAVGGAAMFRLFPADNFHLYGTIVSNSNS
jgi:hypothetical protein